MTFSSSLQPESTDWYERETSDSGPTYQCDAHSTAAKKSYRRSSNRNRHAVIPRESVWRLERSRRYAQMYARALRETGGGKNADNLTVESRFQRLANEWTRETGHISSVSDLINNRRYQEIIGMGWEVVPYLLNDLQEQKRFWFPALAAITGIRPFDSGDASNPRRMTHAWLSWGKRKGLI